jgi:uncharacterized protein (DUF4415 family)
MSKQKSVNNVMENGGGGRPAANEEFWRRTEVYMPKTKQGVFVRLDADVLGWLKAKGKGYQTRMNAMLRVLMESDQTTPRVLATSADSVVGLPILMDPEAAGPMIEISKPARRKRSHVA